MGCKILLAVALSCLTAEIVSAATDKVVCYHGTWSAGREGNGRFTVNDIDPTLCTHLIYSFVGINADGSIRFLSPNLDINQGNIKSFNDLKSKNKNLKTLFAIGGWNGESSVYSAVAASPQKRRTLIQSALALIRTHGFDGFDLDWEYPGQRGGQWIDKQNFAILIKEFREEWDKQGLLLTAAVAAAQYSVELSYDVPALSKYLDFINVMAYDLHGSWEGVTGQNAPLYPSAAEIRSNQVLLNIDAVIKNWIQKGAAPEKLVLGLGVYGRSYTLSNPSNTQVGAPISGGGVGGRYTKEAGLLGYNEIVELQKEGGWVAEWDDNQKNPYLYKGNQWIGYDDPKSIALKVEYAKNLKLGGVMIWSIETDDFRGVSGTKYAILKSINNALGGIAQPEEPSKPAEPKPQPKPEPKPEPKPQPPKVEPIPIKPSPVSDELCAKEGYIRDPKDCSSYYYCLSFNGGFVPLRQSCSAGLMFDPSTVRCDYPAQVQC